MMIKLFWILAACVAVNHGLKCIVCTTREQGDDCQKNPSKFSTDCQANEVCATMKKGTEIERSCKLLEKGDGNGVNPRNDCPSPYECCGDQDHCNDKVGVGGGGGPPASPGGGEGDPASAGGPPGGSADDTGSSSDRKKFNISCWLFTISTLTIFTHFYTNN